MLQLLNDTFTLGYSDEELAALAARLGADCAFFIRNRPALATGIGDLLEPIDLDLSHLKVVVVKPDIGVSTAEAYAMITPATGTEAPGGCLLTGNRLERADEK